MNKVCIVGVGLIGGSFGLALRKAGFSGRIVGVSSPATIEKAVALGVIDEARPLAEAAAASDLIFLAQPIRRILETLEAIDDGVRPGALITDAGSTKREIVARAAERIRRGRFVGGHPMAGKEARGVEFARADLFTGNPWVLTGRDAELEAWIERTGARLVFLDAETHDRLVAVASHVPQLASVALAAAIGESGAGQVAGPGAADMTRLAGSAWEVWRDILATNADWIDAALGAYIARLEELRGKLRGGEMAEEFARAAAAARGMR